MTFDHVVAAITALGAVIAAFAAMISAHASKKSTESARETMRSNEHIAENDRRIRLLEERMKVWNAFIVLRDVFTVCHVVNAKTLKSTVDTMQPAIFLFDQEVSIYLNILSAQLRHHLQKHERLQNPAAILGVDGLENEAREELIRQKEELEMEINTRLDEGKSIFIRHMSLM
ncbi:TPA: hypothetical protein MIP51_19520 [Klebsiella pneumoniae]|nr:hypothetical protein [Klebsiella pneumoniae]